VQIDFRASARPSLGVEWEFALVDHRTRDLANCAGALFDAVAGRVDAGKIHQELLRNTVEVVTGVCDTVGEAVEDLRSSLDVVVPAAAGMGVDLFGAGAHPFAEWSAQHVSEGHRYAELINRTQWWGRQMLIWGVHVHVGMPSVDRVMPVLSSLLNTFPHLQALSASSPVWAGTDTGYASNRALMFQQLPTAGLPFQFATWAEYESFCEDSTVTGVIEGQGDIRWDIRPSAHNGTIENRVCDGISDLGELSALVALMHCLAVDLDRRLAAGETLPSMPPWHVQENKWRAARYGLEAEIIVDAQSRERLVTDDLDDLLIRLEPVAASLGCAEELRRVADIPVRGASYQRQRRVAEATGGDLVAVVSSVVEELETSLALPSQGAPQPTQ